MNINEYLEIYGENEYIVNIPDKLPFEIFLPITPDVVPGIRNGYYISNYSRVYNTATNKYLKCGPMNHPDYYPSFTVMCVTEPFERKITLHRMLMMIFDPVDGMDNLVVNHKDGIKYHSFIPNLEWTTECGNMQHAVKHNLMHPVYGETHACATITEDTCKEICTMLESRRYQNSEIASMFGINVHIVDSIRQGKAWKHISKDYDLNYDKERISKVFSYDQLCQICEYFQDNPKSSNESLRSYLHKTLAHIGFDPINESTVNSIRKLYKKERWKFIYCNYNY